MRALMAVPEKKSWKAVYTIVERADKKHWIRIGVAFVNQDSSLNVKLDATPTNGLLHIRDYEPFEAGRNRSAEGEE